MEEGDEESAQTQELETIAEVEENPPPQEEQPAVEESIAEPEPPIEEPQNVEPTAQEEEPQTEPPESAEKAETAEEEPPKRESSGGTGLDEAKHRSRSSQHSVKASKSIHYETPVEIIDENAPKKVSSHAEAHRKSSINLGKKSSSIQKRSGSDESRGSLRKHLSSFSLSKEFGTRSRSDRLIGSSSKARAVVGSVLSIKRLSTTGEAFDRKTARYANTYKLYADNPFNAEKVEKILKDVMVEALDNLTYDADKCPKQAKWASSAIRAKVKELEFDRYKLVCLVTIGEKNSQDVLVTCRFLWDVERDRYATFSLENTHVFGIAQCFGIYYE